MEYQLTRNFVYDFHLDNVNHPGKKLWEFELIEEPKVPKNHLYVFKSRILLTYLFIAWKLYKYANILKKQIFYNDQRSLKVK